MRKFFEKDRVLILVGMTFFWSFFRHPTLMQRMFPVGKTVSLFGADISLFAVFLGACFVLSILAFIFSAKLAEVIASKRWIVLVLSIIATLAVIMNFSSQENRGVLFWISTVVFATGFIAIYLSWATYFSRHFSLESLVELTVTFFLSLLIFTAVSLYLAEFKQFLVEMIPFVCGLCFYLLSGDVGGAEVPAGSSAPGTTGKIGEKLRSTRTIPKNKLLYVVLFIAFLLAGSLTRGIVDTMNGFSVSDVTYNFRWIVSMFIGIVIIALYFIRYRKFARLVDERADIIENYDIQRYEEGEAEQLTLLCWVFLMVVFFAGMFIIVMQQSYAIGGHIVVAARSSLDFLLWVLLCSIAASENLKTNRLFLVCGMMTEIASWAISYLAMPSVVVDSPDFFASPAGMIVMFSMFFLIATLTLVFGAISLRKETVLMPRLAPTTQDAVAGVPEEVVRRYHLTAREAEVAWLFAQGFSLSKVASELFISIGTAQSHMKNIYRKLGVHSKDELIDLLK